MLWLFVKKGIFCWNFLLFTPLIFVIFKDYHFLGESSFLCKTVKVMHQKDNFLGILEEKCGFESSNSVQSTDSFNIVQNEEFVSYSIKTHHFLTFQKPRWNHFGIWKHLDTGPNKVRFITNFNNFSVMHSRELCWNKIWPFPLYITRVIQSQTIFYAHARLKCEPCHVKRGWKTSVVYPTHSTRCRYRGKCRSVS